MRPSLQTNAIILRRTNYGEADRIVNFLTPNDGKLSAIAKGVRKPSSKLAGSLELFAESSITIAPGKTGMGIVTSARLILFYGNILQAYDRTELAYAVLKQINKIAETVAEPEFYDALRDTLVYLNNLALDIRLVELWARLKLAALLGRGLNVSTDIAGSALQAGELYNFDFTDMAFTKHPSGQFNEGHIKLLRLASVKTPEVLSKVGGLSQLLDGCLWLARLIET